MGSVPFESYPQAHPLLEGENGVYNNSITLIKIVATAIVTSCTETSVMLQSHLVRRNIQEFYEWSAFQLSPQALSWVQNMTILSGIFTFRNKQ